MTRWTAVAGWAGALACVVAVIAGGMRLDGYSHALHPLALLGADGVPNALVFNLVGFIVPGLLATVVALGLYRALPAAAGWLPRIGARMLLVSALAFAAQGLFPLDPQDMDGQASGLHAAAWMIWWIAFVAGAPLLASVVPRIRMATLAAAGALLATMFVPPSLLDPPYAQRIALAAWLLWLAIVPRQAGRPGVHESRASATWG